MKLIKVQKEMLRSAVDTLDEYSVRKPIHCDLHARDKIDEYSASYARYNKAMYALLDAGIIGHDAGDRVSVHAYILDYNKARQLLTENNA